jgi:hypothetical protein
VDKEVGLSEILARTTLATVKLTGIVCGELLAAGSLIVIVAVYAPGARDAVE